MKEHKKKVIPQHEIEELVGVTCDFCGAKGKHEWNSSSYTTDETEISVEISHNQGENYPSGRIGDKFTCDMCPRCFRDKLVPFLQSIALPERKLDYEDWSW